MKTKTNVKYDNANNITLPITVNGLVATIAPGNFRIRENSYILPDAFTYTIKPNNKRQWIGFYIMKSKSDGSIVVVIDELIGDLAPLNMSQDPDYDYLWYLGSLTVEVKDKTLSKATLFLVHSVDPSPVDHTNVESPLYPKRVRVS